MTNFTDRAVSATHDRLSGFSRHLRLNGVASSTDALLDAHTIISAGYSANRHLLRHAFRANFCQRQSDWQRFDALFDAYWRAPGELTSDEDGDISVEGDGHNTDAGIQSLLGFSGSSSLEQAPEIAGAGDYKALSLADFRFMFDPAEMLAVEALIDTMARQTRRQFLRKKTLSRKGQQLAFKRSARNALRTQGQFFQLHYRSRQRRLPRFVLLLDISQSMDVYAKLFLRFTRHLVKLFEQSEAFAFNTELIPLGRGHRGLTEETFEHTINAKAKGWLGGTRIGESLATFNEQHLRQSINSRTTVIIFSDGCDTGTPQALHEQVKIIQRRARKLLWVNPLLGRFEPGEADRNMDPVKPAIDRYLAAHNLESLSELSHELIR